MAHTCDTATPETKAEGVQVHGHPRLDYKTLSQNSKGLMQAEAIAGFSSPLIQIQIMDKFIF